VEFCYRVGMDYVSCSPYHVPIARLAAAQAAISGEKTETMRTVWRFFTAEWQTSPHLCGHFAGRFTRTS